MMIQLVYMLYSLHFNQAPLETLLGHTQMGFNPDHKHFAL